jgi:hypothetical protein
MVAIAKWCEVTVEPGELRDDKAGGNDIAIHRGRCFDGKPTE